MPTATLLNPTDLKTKEFLAKIGEIVVLSRHLESIIEFFIEDLINPEGKPIMKQRVTDSIIRKMESLEKLDIVRDLIVERVGIESQKKFLPTYKLIKECIEKRNDTVHSLWFIQYGNTEAGIAPLTQKINPQYGHTRGRPFDFSKAITNIELDALTSLTNKLNRTIAEVANYMANHGET